MESGASEDMVIDSTVSTDTIPFSVPNTPLLPENMVTAERDIQCEEKEAFTNNEESPKMEVAMVEGVSELRSAHFAQLLQRLRSENGISLPENGELVVLGALRTLVNILSNILTFPNEAKYRVIKQSNSVFRSKILSVNGALDLLQAMGFEENKEKDCLELPFAVKVFALSEVMKMLNQAYADLESEVNISSQEAIKEEEQKMSTGEERKVEVTEERKSVDKMDSFDPYKSNIFRTSIQVLFRFKLYSIHLLVKYMSAERREKHYDTENRRTCEKTERTRGRDSGRFGDISIYVVR